jgi:nucleoside-diphosphate-sugar epimerase
MAYKIFVTGGAGYVGEMLCAALAKRSDVEAILVLDKSPITPFLEQIPKLTYLEDNMANDTWQATAAAFAPDVVIHAAWQIRNLYNQADIQWHWNVHGSNNVFAFAAETTSVKRLIHFSTAASYAATIDNKIDQLFTEAGGLRDDDYRYAKEKKVAEDNLSQLISARQAAGQITPQVTVLRLAAVTGPRGRFQKIRFGLQSALAGDLKSGFLQRLVSTLTAVMPATKTWVRQFVHEDDVVDVVLKFSFEPFSYSYEAFNVVPVSDPVLPSDMGRIVGKRVLYLPPWLIRIVFFGFWHLTRGRIPTAPHVWRFYSYPIVMSGAKLATIYTCQYSCKEAIEKNVGRYKVAV